MQIHHNGQFFTLSFTATERPTFGEMCQAQPSNGRVRSEMMIITYNNSFEEVMSDGDMDKIEILSSQIEDTDEFFLAPVSQSDVEELEKLVQKEKERRRVARMVVLVSGILFMISVALVAVSLYMSRDIDELVRNSNEMLRRHNDRMSQGTQLREQHTLPVTVNVTLHH
ncbi:hypothetical protein CHS0354_010593 [Potamilus streckersoni]|uniref:Uncharacterized protein n=1 Tax=Potamilus streckersoni TaxID=2493646 RepID=A0AAE0VPV0_9BIVA|nr:hypothetical protein CHS0354_010593 [Potamilus streckersoni]